jgi:hypothetical protein
MLNRLRFSAVGWSGLLLLSLALAACSGQPTAAPAETAAETPTQAAEVSQAAEKPPTTEAQETPTEVAADPPVSPVTPAETVVAAAKPVVCEPVEIPVNSKIAAINDKDWVKGPAAAPVTLIEYGDFQ